VAAESTQVVDHLGRQREGVGAGEPAHGHAVRLEPADLVAQLGVDLGQRGGELVGFGLEQLPNAGEGHARLAERLDADKIDDRLGVVAPVPGGVAGRLREDAALVVVAYRPHGDAGDVTDRYRWLPAGRHRLSVPVPG
jgi:hypothetical protein